MHFRSYSQLQSYVDVAPALSVDHSYGEGLPGAGISLADFTGDGWDDLTLATGQDSLIYFYVNSSGTLQKIPALIDSRDQVKQILWADFDNDGDRDLFITCYDAPNRLYEHRNNLELVDITTDANLPLQNRLTYGASFVDFNRDGLLDIYVCERLGPDSAQFNSNRLFKNLGDGSFEDISESSNSRNYGRKPFCATFFDYNLDKWPDLYIANDRNSGNVLYQNEHDGTFTDQSVSSRSDLIMNAMCVTIGDYNQDGLPDIYVTNTEEGNALLQNSGQGIFSEVAIERGVAFNKIGWASNFVDGDNDGDLDLYVSGILQSDTTLSSFYYKNTGGTFSHFNEGFVSDTATSYTNAIGDLDQDGRLEIVVNNHGPYSTKIWRDVSTNENNYVIFDLEGVVSNRDAIGSLVEIFSNLSKQVAYSHCGEGFLGQNSYSIHFGLGDATTIDSVRITWPSGHVDKLFDVNINQKNHVREGSSTGGNINIDEDVEILITHVADKVLHSDLLLKIYPNPVGDYLQLESDNNGWGVDGLKYEIWDEGGKLLQSGQTTMTDYIDVELLPPGFFTLMVRTSKGRLVGKFLKN